MRLLFPLLEIASFVDSRDIDIASQADMDGKESRSGSREWNKSAGSGYECGSATGVPGRIGFPSCSNLFRQSCFYSINRKLRLKENNSIY